MEGRASIDIKVSELQLLGNSPKEVKQQQQQPHEQKFSETEKLLDFLLTLPSIRNDILAVEHCKDLPEGKEWKHAELLRDKRKEREKQGKCSRFCDSIYDVFVFLKDHPGQTVGGMIAFVITILVCYITVVGNIQALQSQVTVVEQKSQLLDEKNQLLASKNSEFEAQSTKLQANLGALNESKNQLYDQLLNTLNEMQQKFNESRAAIETQTASLTATVQSMNETTSRFLMTLNATVLDDLVSQVSIVSQNLTATRLAVESLQTSVSSNLAQLLLNQAQVVQDIKNLNTSVFTEIESKSQTFDQNVASNLTQIVTVKDASLQAIQSLNMSVILGISNKSQTFDQSVASNLTQIANLKDASLLQIEQANFSAIANITEFAKKQLSQMNISSISVAVNSMNIQAGQWTMFPQTPLSISVVSPRISFAIATGTWLYPSGCATQLCLVSFFVDGIQASNPFYPVLKPNDRAAIGYSQAVYLSAGTHSFDIRYNCPLQCNGNPVTIGCNVIA